MNDVNAILERYRRHTPLEHWRRANYFF